MVSIVDFLWMLSCARILVKMLLTTFELCEGCEEISHVFVYVETNVGKLGTHLSQQLELFPAHVAAVAHSDPELAGHGLVLVHVL